MMCILNNHPERDSFIDLDSRAISEDAATTETFNFGKHSSKMKFSEVLCRYVLQKRQIERI
jgi:hypothetical protein